MLTLTYESLSADERASLCNGCGGKATIDVPDFHSTETCNRHDLAYWIGGTEDDRAVADYRLWDDMRRDARAALPRWWQVFQRQALYAVAWTYYQAVRREAASHFHFGTPRGRAELDARMASRRKVG